jgi:hypothetical protein
LVLLSTALLETLALTSPHSHARGNTIVAGDGRAGHQPGSDDSAARVHPAAPRRQQLSGGAAQHPGAAAAPALPPHGQGRRATDAGCGVDGRLTRHLRKRRHGRQGALGRRAVELPRADGKQLCCRHGTAVKTALAGSKPGFGRGEIGDVALNRPIRTGTGRAPPVPQKSSQQPWRSPVG